MTPAPAAMIPRWAQWLPWVLLGTFSCLWLARWVTFPLFLDPYYHLLVARQVMEAGGPIGYEWWEAAPVGRPHLYPPVIHLLLAGLLRAGIAPVTAIRVVSVALPPVILLAMFLVVRRLFSARAAVGALLAGLMPFSWMLQTSHGLASGLATIELLALLLAAARRRWVAVSALLGLLCYTHLGLPWIALVTLGLSAMFGAIGPRRPLIASLAGGLALGLPWLWHVARHQAVFHLAGRLENRNVELAVALYALAAIGAWRGWKAGGAGRVLVALGLASCLMARSFTYRWLSGEGLAAVILLAGCGASELAGWIGNRVARPHAPWWALAGLGIGMALAPTVRIGETGVTALWPDSALFHLLNAAGVERKHEDAQFYTRPSQRLAEAVARLTRPGEIVWSNANYAGGMIAGLAGRATSSMMFYEVAPAEPFDPIGAAQFIVWFKIGPMAGVPSLEAAMSRYRLQVVADSPLALLLRNPAAAQHSRRPEALIPSMWAFVLLCGLIGLAVWDLRRTPGSQ